MSVVFNYLKVTPYTAPASRPELSFLTSASVDNATAVTTPTTFSAVDLGAEDANRYIVVVGHIFGNASGGTITGITVAGSPATLVAQGASSGTTCSVGIWIIYMPTGTSSDIVLSVSQGTESRGIAVYRMISTAGGTVNSSNTDTSATGTGIRSAAITASSVGVVIAGSTAVNGSDPTWTNVTEQYAMDMRSGEWASGGINTTAADGSLTVSSSSGRALAVACFL